MAFTSSSEGVGAWAATVPANAAKAAPKSNPAISFPFIDPPSRTRRRAGRNARSAGCHSRSGQAATSVPKMKTRPPSQRKLISGLR